MTIAFQLLLLSCWSAIVFDKENSPYIFTEDYLLKTTDTLIITEGTNILLGPGVNMLFFGHVFVKGTADEPVQFKPLEEGEGWGKLDIKRSGTNVDMEYVRIIEGTMHATDTDVRLFEIEFENSQNLPWNGAIARIIGGAVNINSCSIQGSDKGEGFLIHDSDSVVIQNCFFKAIPDAVEFINIDDGIIRNNIFVDNPDDAIDINFSRNIIIDSNYISNAYDCGFEIGAETFGSAENIMLSRNIIENCQIGVIVKEGSSASIVNCTFYGNATGLVSVEDVSGKGGSFIKVSNTILSQSVEADTYSDEFSIIEISFSLSDTQLLPGIANLFNEPGFVNASNGNYALRSLSACIDSGDPSSPLDPDGTRADMGAIYYDVSSGLAFFPNPFDHIKIYPNPVVDHLSIEFGLMQPENVEIKLLGTDARELITIVDEYLEPGDKRIQTDLSERFTGYSGYMILIVSIGNETRTYKLISLDK